MDSPAAVGPVLLGCRHRLARSSQAISRWLGTREDTVLGSQVGARCCPTAGSPGSPRSDHASTSSPQRSISAAPPSTGISSPTVVSLPSLVIIGVNTRRGGRRGQHPAASHVSVVVAVGCGGGRASQGGGARLGLPAFSPSSAAGDLPRREQERRGEERKEKRDMGPILFFLTYMWAPTYFFFN